MTDKQYKQVQYNILAGKVVLVDYQSFFLDTRCKFSLDEDSDLEVLDKTICKLLSSERQTKIYVCIYYDETDIGWYSDMIVLDTSLTVKEIASFFVNRHIEPSAISILDGQTFDLDIQTFVNVEPDGKCNDYSPSNTYTIDLYWD